MNISPEPMLEERICDLARLALAVSIIAEDVRTGLADFGGEGLEAIASNLELLFAYIDDTKHDAQALRQAFYAEAA